MLSLPSLSCTHAWFIELQRVRSSSLIRFLKKGRLSFRPAPFGYVYDLLLCMLEVVRDCYRMFRNAVLYAFIVVNSLSRAFVRLFRMCIWSYMPDFMVNLSVDFYWITLNSMRSTRTDRFHVVAARNLTLVAFSLNFCPWRIHELCRIRAGFNFALWCIVPL